MHVVFAPFGWLIARLAHIVYRVGTFFAALVVVGTLVTACPDEVLQVFEWNMSFLLDTAGVLTVFSHSIDHLLGVLGLQFWDIGYPLQVVIEKYQTILGYVSGIVIRVFSPEGVLFFLEVLLTIRLLLKMLGWCIVVILFR